MEGSEYWLRGGTVRLLDEWKCSVSISSSGDYMGINIFKNSSSCRLKICILYICYTSMKERKEGRKGWGEVSFPSLPLFFLFFPGTEGEAGKAGEETDQVKSGIQGIRKLSWE